MAGAVVEAGLVITAADTSFGGTFSYLSGHWSGTLGLEARLVQHLEYSGIIMAISILIAVPLGLYAGHTGRFGGILSLLSNASRALPSLGLVVIFALLLGVDFQAVIIPLVFIALPSLLINTYVGIRGVDRSLVDAAYGMGLTSWQVLWRVEVPVALPLVVLGLRTAALQVVATATIAAYPGVGGLGRFIIDGLASQNSAEVGAGALTVIVLALAVEGLFILAQRLVVSPGVRRRSSSN